MSLARLRRGELLVVAGLLGLVASLFVRWFSIDGVEGSPSFTVFGRAAAGWSYLGTPVVLLLVLLLVAIGTVLVSAATSGGGRPTYGAVVALTVALAVAVLTLLVLLVRLLVATPSPAVDDLGSGAALGIFGTVDRVRDPSTVEVALSLAGGAWLGLAACLAVVVGLWVALADDRTTAPESAVVPPAALPVPPLRSAPVPDADVPAAGDPGAPAADAPGGRAAGEADGDAPPAH